LLEPVPVTVTIANDAATTGEADPAIAGPIAIFDGLPTTDADRRSFTTFTKRDGRQLMLAAVWGQGHFLQ
jgi:hypothetical protein